MASLVVSFSKMGKAQWQVADKPIWNTIRRGGPPRSDPGLQFIGSCTDCPDPSPEPRFLRRPSNDEWAMEPSPCGSTCDATPVSPVAWLERLLEAANPAAVAAVSVDMVQSVSDGESATVLWWLPGMTTPECRPATPPAKAELQLARRVLQRDAAQYEQHGQVLAMRLCKPGAADPRAVRPSTLAQPARTFGKPATSAV